MQRAFTLSRLTAVKSRTLIHDVIKTQDKNREHRSNFDPDLSVN